MLNRNWFFDSCFDLNFANLINTLLIYLISTNFKVRHSLTGPYGGHKPMIRTHRRSVLSESYFAYSGVANCAIPYDLHSIVPQQYFGTVASEIGYAIEHSVVFHND